MARVITYGTCDVDCTLEANQAELDVNGSTPWPLSSLLIREHARMLGDYIVLVIKQEGIVEC